MIQTFRAWNESCYRQAVSYVNLLTNVNYWHSNTTSWPGSSVGIVTGYGLDGPWIESRWGEIFRRLDRPWGPPILLYNGYRVFPGGKVRPGSDADPSPSSSAEV